MRDYDVIVYFARSHVRFSDAKSTIKTLIVNGRKIWLEAHARRKNMKMHLFISLLLSCLFSLHSRADGSLSALMQAMKTDTAVKIAYRENRQMELMAGPWEGSGFMYSLPPDLMIKEQLQPERILMGVKGDRMFYFDPGKSVRYRGEMDEDNPVSLNIGVFRALANADEALLHRLYRIEFQSDEQNWTMTLKPKRDRHSGFGIVISGAMEKQASVIEIREADADGDITEFLLQSEASGDEVEDAIPRLYDELVGD